MVSAAPHLFALGDAVERDGMEGEVVYAAALYVLVAWSSGGAEAIEQGDRTVRRLGLTGELAEEIAGVEDELFEAHIDPAKFSSIFSLESRLWDLEDRRTRLVEQGHAAALGVAHA